MRMVQRLKNLFPFLFVAIYPVVSVIVLKNLRIFESKSIDILVIVILPVFLISAWLIRLILKNWVNYKISKKNINGFVAFMFFSLSMLSPLLTKKLIIICSIYVLFMLISFLLYKFLNKVNYENE